MKKKMFLFGVFACSCGLFAPPKEADLQPEQYVYYRPTTDVAKHTDYKIAFDRAVYLERDVKCIYSNSGPTRMFMVAPNGSIRDCNQEEKDVHKHQIDITKIRGAL